MTTTIFPAPGTTGSVQWTEEFNYFTVPLDNALLSTFDINTVEVSLPSYVPRYNLSYNIVSNYINDYTVIKQTVNVPVDYQTLNFTNNVNGALTFKVGHRLKISVPDTSYTTFITVTGATAYSITFAIPVGFPTTGSNGLRIVNVTTDLYPRTTVFLSNINKTGADFINITNPRDNLFVAEQLPNTRSFKLSTTAVSLSPVTDIPPYSKLEVYTDPALTGNISLPIINQSNNIASSTSNVVKWLTQYEYENVLKISSIVPATTKTIYFDTQPYVPFPAGSTIRIRNLKSYFYGTYTVVTGTTSYVTLNECPLFGTTGAYIDNITNPVRTLSTLLPATSPMNAIENLFFSRMLALKQWSIPVANPVIEPSSSTIVNPVFKLKTPSVNLSVNSTTLKYTVNAVTSYPTKQIASTVTASTTNWTDKLQVVARSGYSAVPSIPTLNTFDGLYNKFNIVKSNAPNVTLYTPYSTFIGEKVRVLSPAFQFDRTFTIISMTANSVTFAEPIDFPLVTADMYLYYGTTVSTSTPVYLSDNSVSIVNKISAFVSPVIDVPLSNQLNKFSAEITGKEVRDVYPYKAGKEYLSTTSTNVTNWSTIPVYVTGIAGGSTSPLIQNWNTFDGLINKISVTKSASPNITLYTTISPYTNFGTTIKIAYATGQSLICNVVSYTPTSVTITPPVNFMYDPILYFNYGMPGTATSVNYTTTDLIPNITKVILAVGTNTTAVPDSNTINKPVLSVRSDGIRLPVETTRTGVVYSLNAPIVEQTKEVSSTTTTTVTTWTVSIPVSLILGQVAVPSIPNWLTFDGLYNKFTLVNPKTQLVTLITPYTVLAGTKVRVVSPIYSFDQIFDIVTLTNTSVSFIRTDNFPSRNIDMIVYYGAISSQVNVIYQPSSNVPTVTKLITEIRSMVANLTVSNIKIPIFVKAEPSALAVSKLETFDNLGYTVDAPITITQTVDYTIPLSLSAYSTNVKNWYIYDYNQITTTSNVLGSTITLNFSPLSFSLGSTVILGNTATSNYQPVTIISSTANSITVSENALGGVYAGWFIYVNTTYSFNQLSYVPFNTGYVKVSDVRSSTAISVPVILGSSSSVTVVKTVFNIPFNTLTASPAVYPSWKLANTITTARDSYYKSGLYTVPRPLEGVQIAAGDLTTIASATTTKPIVRISDVTTQPSSTVKTVTTTPAVVWSEKLSVVRISSFTITPSIPNWLTFDGLNNLFRTIPATNITLTLNSSKYISGDKVRVVAFNYDFTFTVISSYFNSVTFANPGNFPTSSVGLFIYFGQTATSSTVTFTNTSTVPAVAKMSANVVTAVTPPLDVKLLGKLKTSVVETNQLSTVDNIRAAGFYRVSADTTEITYKSSRLETFYNVDRFIENVITTTNAVDNLILVSGRTPTYSTNVVNWLIFDGKNNKVTISPLATPTNVTFYYDNPTEYKPGATVWLYSPTYNYLKSVAVISSTSNSITIVNDTYPLANLYIYISTTLSFAEQYNKPYVPDGKVTVTLTNGGGSFSTYLVASTSNSISFIKPYIVSIPAVGTTITDANPSYFPQGLVYTSAPPINSRELLFYSVYLPYKYTEQTLPKLIVDTATPVKPGAIKLFHVNDTSSLDLPKAANTISKFKVNANSVIDAPLPQSFNPLNNFYNVTIPNVTTNALSQSVYNVVSWYTYDSQILTRSALSGSFTTLRFVNAGTTNIFLFDDVVRLTLDAFNFNQFVTVVSSTVNSITFVTPSSFPADAAGMTIQNYTYPVYSKDQVFTEMSIKGVPFQTASPRENYFASEFKPNIRGIRLTSTAGDFINILPIPSYDKGQLSTFSDPVLTGDFRLAITNQTSLFGQINSNTVSWYYNDLQILTYTHIQQPIRILYFAAQLLPPFAVSSTIRVVSPGSSRSFTVIDCTTTSVSFLQPDTDFSVINAFIERPEATLYPQRLVAPSVNPTNARENLFYSFIRPLSKQPVYAGNDNNQLLTNTFRNIGENRLAGTFTTDNTEGKISKFVVKEIGENTSPLNSANINTPLVKLTGAEVILKPANISKPLMKLTAAESSFKNGNLSKQLMILKDTNSKIVVSTLKTVAKLASVTAINSGRVDKFKVDKIAAITSTDVQYQQVTKKTPIQFWN